MKEFILIVHILIVCALFFVALVVHRLSNNLKKEVKPKAKRKRKTLSDVRDDIFDELN